MAFRPYVALDLLKYDLLPADWDMQVSKAVDTHALHTVLDGKSSTSREPEGSEKTYVDVMMGETISQHLPWLYSLYVKEFCDFASKAFNLPLFPANDISSSVYVNALRGHGSRYEWHVDSNPVTGLLFVTSHPNGHGGELVFEKNNERCVVNPVSGHFLVFDAREIPHAVLGLKTDLIRISVVMNFYHSNVDQWRPSDLKPYLLRTED